MENKIKTMYFLRYNTIEEIAETLKCDIQTVKDTVKAFAKKQANNEARIKACREMKRNSGVCDPSCVTCQFKRSVPQYIK